VLCGQRVMDKMSLITLLGGFSSTGNGAAGSIGVGDNPFAKACAPYRRQPTRGFCLQGGANRN
jgi:hypothetical protein